MNDLVIIGGGPAGLSAAVYAARAGLSVVVIERNFCGGQIALSSGVENYVGTGKVSGQKLAEIMRQQAEESGSKIVYDEIKRIVKNGKRLIAVSENGSYECHSIIIANGAQPRKLGCPGEESFIGKGVSWCTACDGPLYRDMNVAVVGGGESACEEALYLSKICKSVYLIHYKDKFSASDISIKKLALAENIVEFMPYKILSINSDDSGERVGSITVKNVKSETVHDIDVNGIFVAIGYEPCNSNFSELVKLDVNGYIMTKNRNATYTDGIFVAGDTRAKSVRQVVTAVSDGAVAALQARDYILTAIFGE